MKITLTRRHALLAVATVTAVATVGGATIALAGSSKSELASARTATAKFRSVTVAEAAGYGELRDAKKIACIAQPEYGGMGIHYVNGSLVKDAVLDPERPEALVYQPVGGKLKLGALEYIVFAKAWKKASPPELFGRTFDYVAAGNRYGLPAFWALHAWVWKPNPTGTVMAWNPKVTCP